ncbi:MAG: hypothetical protein ACRCUZ_15345, partial [Shewanella sp.]
FLVSFSLLGALDHAPLPYVVYHNIGLSPLSVTILADDECCRVLQGDGNPVGCCDARMTKNINNQ